MKRKTRGMKFKRWCISVPNKPTMRNWKKALRLTLDDGKARISMVEHSACSVELVWPKAVTIDSAKRLVKLAKAKKATFEILGEPRGLHDQDDAGADGEPEAPPAGVADDTASTAGDLAYSQTSRLATGLKGDHDTQTKAAVSFAAAAAASADAAGASVVLTPAELQLVSSCSAPSIIETESSRVDDDLAGEDSWEDDDWPGDSLAAYRKTGCCGDLDISCRLGCCFSFCCEECHEEHLNERSEIFRCATKKPKWKRRRKVVKKPAMQKPAKPMKVMKVKRKA